MKLLLWVLISSLLWADHDHDDLDIPAAKAKYEYQQAEADRAKRDMDAKESVLRRAQDQYYNAKSDLEQAKQALQSAEYKLTSLNSEIKSLEDKLVDLTHQINQLETEKDSKVNELNSLKSDLHDLEHRLDNAKREVEQAESKLAAEKAKPQPDAALVAQLEAEKNTAQIKVHDLEDKLKKTNHKVSKTEQRISEIDRTIRDCRLEYQKSQNRIQEATREREQQLYVIADCRRAVERAEDRVEDCYRDLTQAQYAYDQAKRNWQYEQSLADSAYQYLQEVIANYEREKNRVIELATRTGRTDGNQEAAERAPEVAQADGLARAKTTGVETGSQESSAKNWNQGYRQGRTSGHQIPEVLPQYHAGRNQGISVANDKGVKEDFPKGYNDSLAQLLSNPPPNETTLDITDSLPIDPGLTGVDLSGQSQAIGNVGIPQFPMPIDPVYHLPAMGSVSVSVPSPLLSNASPPCSGMKLPEFTPLCLNTYDAEYKGAFRTHYQSVYLASYKQTYDLNIKTYYDTGLATAHPQSTTQGLARGASDLGHLDGFAFRYPQAKEEQYKLGTLHLSQILETGNLSVFRSLSLTESSGDSLFTPGDKIKALLVMDNYGGKHTAYLKTKLQITSLANLLNPNFTVRELPSLAPRTRTRLIGVTSMDLLSVPAGTEASLKGSLTGTPSASLDASVTVHYPVELEAITLAKKPKIDEAVTATLRFRNLTSERLTDLKPTLFTKPVIVTAGEAVEIPEILAGETAEVPTTIKPGMWVGQNTYVPFLSEVAGVHPQAVQPVHSYLELDRDAVLLLYDNAGKDIASSTVDVSAGSRLSFLIKFKFLRTQSLSGPFIVKTGKRSSDSITHSNNSTTSVNYGSVSPGMNASPIRFSYDIPASLKGQRHWVMINLTRGNKILHALQLHVNVQ